MLRISAWGAHTWTISIRKSCSSSSIHCNCYRCPALNSAEHKGPSENSICNPTWPPQPSHSKEELKLQSVRALVQQRRQSAWDYWEQGRGQPNWQGTPGPVRDGHQCWNRDQIMLIRWAAEELWAFPEINVCTTQSSSSEELASILSGGISVLDR